MIQDNLDYLKNMLRYTGFGEALFGSLEEKLNAREPKFELNATHVFSGQKMDAVLQFDKSPRDDFYFFNRYIATLFSATGPRSHRFYNHSFTSQNISFKEAFNLLSGRSVCKDYVKKEDEVLFRQGEEVPVQKVWIQLDPENKDEEGFLRKVRFFEGYGYHVEKALERAQLKNKIYTDQLSPLVHSLEKGNRVLAVLQEKEGVRKVWLEACPEYKTLNMFDEEGKKLYLPKKSEAVEKKGEDRIPSVKDTDEGALKKKRSKRIIE